MSCNEYVVLFPDLKPELCRILTRVEASVLGAPLVEVGAERGGRRGGGSKGSEGGGEEEFHVWILFSDVAGVKVEVVCLCVVDLIFRCCWP